MRLKGENTKVMSNPSLSFQFQTGAIKRFGGDLLLDVLGMFQFQTGAIKRSANRTPQSLELLGFNSKLVRLKGIRSS